MLLPSAGPATLLRALFKRPATGAAGAISTRFELLPPVLPALARYNRLLGFAPDALPVTFYYLLAQRAHLGTMLLESFPFRPAGMIHVDNAIVEQRRVDGARPLELCTTVDFEPVAANGARYCSLRTVGAQDAVQVFECSSRYLAVRGQRRERAAGDVPAPPPGRTLGEWTLTLGSGRAYAAVSGDWNPIHLWQWSARLMGIRRPIIHGMHTVAKACALLEQAHGKRLTAISARFCAPIALGATAVLSEETEGRYRVLCSAASAVEGSFS